MLPVQRQIPAVQLCVEAVASISNFNPGEQAQPTPNPGTDLVDHEISNGIGDFQFLADPSVIDWDDFMSDINVLNGAPSQTWPTAGVASGATDTMKGIPDAVADQSHTITPPDHAPNQSITNITNSTQIEDNNNTGIRMDTPDGHGSNEGDCLSTVIDIMTSLHVPKPTCRSHQPSVAAQIPSVDVVLARNKQRIKRSLGQFMVFQVVHTLERIMHCSCSLDRQLGSLIGITISKLLNWYAAAARTDTSQSGSSPAAAFQPGSHEHATSLPITLGTYQMEGLDVSMVRVMLVTREAEARIGPLLNLFERRFCVADGPESSMSKYSIPITRYTEGILREKLKHLTQETTWAKSSLSKAKKTTTALS
ncbi:MAG: hypothetical protein Q9165_003586 [Trypethelium subeluteriae]